MDSAALLQEARLSEALTALKDEVRQAPSQVELRVRLFALNCVLGRFEPAATDLDVIQSLDKGWSLSARVYQRLLASELLRREVFAGRARPTILGEPESWVAWNVQALALEATELAAAQDLRKQAWDAAPEYASVVNGQSCQWLSDADRRLGPVLEACLDGAYYWIPFGQLRSIEPHPPEFLVETVWLPAKLTLASGAEVRAHLPARYPGTENVPDGRLCLGQRTGWEEQTGGGTRPLGQKLLESEASDFGLLECRRIEFAGGETAAGNA
jgi:type VI secretion system protein ImpE